jgi:hypothetical protein
VGFTGESKTCPPPASREATPPAASSPPDSGSLRGRTRRPPTSDARRAAHAGGALDARGDDGTLLGSRRSRQRRMAPWAGAR